MKGYKAFDKGFVCRGLQYAENTVFEAEGTEGGCSGIHFCKDPLEVLTSHPLVNSDGELSEFADVEALDKCTTIDGKKFLTRKLKIGAKISFAKLVQKSIKAAHEKLIKDTAPQIMTNDNGIHSAQIGSSGDFAQIGSSGDFARMGSSGASARIGSSGDFARINSTGKYSVICCAGGNSRAKGKIGSWITLSEWKYSKEEEYYIPICVKTKKIDGVNVKEDTYYLLKGGKFVEVEE